MAPPEKVESGGSGYTGTVATVGMVCGFIGAVIGAVGLHFWKKEEMQQHQSSSGSSKTYNTGTCPICLSEMEELKVLPCGHQYHNACVEHMMKSGVEKNCPVCRKYFGK